MYSWSYVEVIVHVFVCCFVHVARCNYERHKLHVTFRRDVTLTIQLYTPLYIIWRTQNIFFQEEPFMMYRKGHKNLTGNDRFEGYCVDLIHELSIKLDFKYELYLVNDNQFGASLPDGHWNGMMGEVLAGVSFKIYRYFAQCIVG